VGQRTYQTRLHLPPEVEALLEAYAELYARAERGLFAAMARGVRPEDLKGAFQRRFGLTARQFNAICRGLKGKVASVRERRRGLIAEARARVAKAERRIRCLERRLRREGDAGRRRALRQQIHQKKRRLATLRARLARLEADREAGQVRLCFGGRRLFRAQFHLEASGYGSLEAWREAWRRARAGQFFVLGSKDETAGCQGCVAEHLGQGRFAFRLRLPDALVGQNGGEKHLRFEAVLRYGTDPVVAALTLGQALSYRFLRDEKGWRLFVSTEALPCARRSDRRLGVIGIDINADHLAVTETDRHGNPLRSLRVPLVTYGCSRDQARAHRRGRQTGDGLCAGPGQAARGRAAGLRPQEGAARGRGRALQPHALGAGLCAHPRHPEGSGARCGAGGAGGQPGLQHGHRPAQVRRPVRAVRSSGRRAVHRAAGPGSFRAAEPPHGRPGRLPPTREESGEARLGVLAAGRAEGSGACSAPAAGHGPILPVTCRACAQQGTGCDPAAGCG